MTVGASQLSLRISHLIGNTLVAKESQESKEDFGIGFVPIGQAVSPHHAFKVELLEKKSQFSTKMGTGFAGDKK